MNSSSSRTNASKGFTLIELLVVIAIIALLASIILASLNGAQQKGRDATRSSDLNELQTAIELYSTSVNHYPDGTGAAEVAGTPLAVLVSAGDIAAIPSDPSGGSFYYMADSNGSYYCLGAKMETTPVPTSTCTNSGYKTALATGVGGTASTTYTVGP